MRLYRDTCVLVLCATAFALPAYASADSELKVTHKGEVSAKNVYVIQKAGSTMYTRAEWGSTYVRIIVQTSSSTKITKNHGEAATVGDIEVGHVLEIEGAMLPGSDTLIITATKIRDTKLLKESKGVSGTIKSLDAQTQTFVVEDKALGDVTVIVLSSTPITQGKRQISFSSLKKGDKVLSAPGTYDYASKTLSPTSIEIYQSKDIFAKKNFQGTLVSITGATLPADLRVRVDGVEYMVHMSEKTTVLNKSKSPTNLKRFAEGDIVRFYGGILETNLSEIDAEVVRNLNF